MIKTSIKSIEMIGLLENCKDECSHFCIVEYMDKTSHTVKLNSKQLINNYWEYLNEPSKYHLLKKNSNNSKPINFKSIYINPICSESYICIHKCIIKFLDDIEIIKDIKGDEISNIYWDCLTEAGKIHFGKYNKNINYSNLSQ